MTKALLALGSNLGDRVGYLRGAVAELGKAVIQTSHIYETPPWPPGEDAPMYLNAVIMVEQAGIDAHGWLEKTQQLEISAGRERSDVRRYAPRTLDADLLMVWNDANECVFLDEATLVLPHPRAHLRAFVLRPWLDIQPEGEIPGVGSIKDLLHNPAVATDLKQIRQLTEDF